MSAEHRNNPSLLPEPESGVESESIKVSPERYRPLALLVNHCAAVSKRPEARESMLASVTLFINRGLDRYSQTDF